MRLDSLRLQNFRNIASLDLRLESNFHFFCGDNGQGKTNLLEAVYFLSHLRSFRTQETRNLIRWEQSEMGIGVDAYCEVHKDTTIGLKADKTKRFLQVDGEQITRFSDYLGRLPAVVLSSHDIQLLRGSPGLRRRFVDMTLASIDVDYFRSLRDYHRAIRERNVLLKSAASDAELKAFEHVLAKTGSALIQKRTAFSTELGEMVASIYGEFAPKAEKPGLFYKPDQSSGTDEELKEMYARYRQRDRQFQSTSKGPHRDEFEFALMEKDARDAGSEGQQRGLVIALRMAQSTIIREYSGINPIVLADDILTELDEKRRIAFWKVVPENTQVLATGTKKPESDAGQPWVIHRVEDGTVL